MSDQLDFLAVTESAYQPVQKKVSRDEMNLAEFPLSVLSTRVNPGKKTLEFKDSIFDKNGNPITRQWVITAADKFGLPTSSDDEVLLGLIKISVDKGLDKRKVYFTRYELLRVLRWSTEGRSYSRLTNALDRLSGVRIKATNSFYDNEKKAYSTRNFGVIDAYEINSGRSQNPKPSYFIWSEALYKSFSSGFIKKLDFDFFLELESSVTKRLYRFLDKHFWYRTKLKMNLFTLAHEKIGVSRTYRYPSSLRQQIDPAAEELIAKGFLADVQYVGKGKHTEVTFIAAGDNGNRSANRNSSKRKSKNPTQNLSNSEPRNTGSISTGEEALIHRGIRPNQAHTLVRRFVSPREKERAQQIINYFDAQLKAGVQFRNAPGFLYQALYNMWDFELPDDDKTQKSYTTPKSYKSPQKSKSSNDEDSLKALQSEYLIERKRDLEKLRGEVEPNLLGKLEGEVKTALENIKGLISQSGFHEAVSHGVEERIAKLFAYPDFDEWQKKRPRKA